MRLFWIAAFSALATACTSTETDETDEPIICEPDGTYDIEVTGKVEDATGAAVAGADVALKDYYNAGASLGSATTNATGIFVLDAVGVTDIPNCWGTVLQYDLEASEGGRTGVKQINSNLHSAITNTSLNTDITSFPVVIE